VGRRTICSPCLLDLLCRCRFEYGQIVAGIQCSEGGPTRRHLFLNSLLPMMESYKNCMHFRLPLKRRLRLACLEAGTKLLQVISISNSWSNSSTQAFYHSNLCTADLTLLRKPAAKRVTWSDPAVHYLRFTIARTFSRG
jgi:hypothetical protein